MTSLAKLHVALLLKLALLMNLQLALLKLALLMKLARLTTKLKLLAGSARAQHARQICIVLKLEMVT